MGCEGILSEQTRIRISAFYRGINRWCVLFLQIPRPLLQHVGCRHISGLIRTEKDPHCIILVVPRDTGCLLCFSFWSFSWQSDEQEYFDFSGRRRSGTENS